LRHALGDPSYDSISEIRETVDRAASVVRQLLTFSRRATLQRETLDLGEALTDTAVLLRRLVREDVDLAIDYGPNLPQVRIDRSQLETAIINLVVNARDALRAKGGGAVRIRVARIGLEAAKALGYAGADQSELALLEVADDGPGIPPDALAKIFEPFFTTKDVGKGTGLGLSMVYGIIKQTGGYVFCESEPGAGATFRILLPRRQGDEADEPVKKEAAKPAADLTGRGAILLVEDEEAVRAFAARALASRGYTVLQAETGVDALSVAENAAEPIDLIVSDVIMPEMDGPTMLTELRRRGLTAKVIFVSGYADDAFARNLPEGQEFVFLPKPFSLKQLIETVKGVMN
jgi:two-component system cell cycle sensor histidine kinase/response regulator CckA